LDHAVAYFNVDVAVAGSEFGAEAVPSLKQFVREVTQEVPSPKGGSVYFQWKLAGIGRGGEGNSEHKNGSNASSEDVAVGDLGSGSDFTPFLQHVGVPSTDIGSHGPYGVYHSVFDNYAWFTMNADPSFVYLQQMARILGLEALHMADTDVLPYDYVTYGKEIQSYLESARKKKAAAGMDFGPAEVAAARFIRAAESARQVQGKPGTDLTKVNAALRATETAFIAEAGLPNRPWYKHTIYAPGEYTGYAAVVIPGVNEALDAKNPASAEQQLIALTKSINLAAQTLETVH
jgi:N-acetylated-alpha-linked acidic dipeptidase